MEAGLWLGAGLNFHTARPAEGGAWVAMSNLQTSVDQRAICDGVKLCIDLAGELTTKTRAPAESQGAHRIQVKEHVTLRTVLEEIKNRLDASISRTKSTGGSKYVAARKAAENKWTALEHGEELPSSTADKVQGWLQES